MTHSPEEIEDRLWSEIDRAGFGMLGLVGTRHHFQPMTAFTEKPAGLIWFFARRDSELARMIGAEGADAMFVVQSRDQGLQACLGGRLTLSHDLERIDRFWGPMVSAWHPHGRDDPDLTLMRLDCVDAEVWLTEAGPRKYAWEVARSNMHGERPDLAERAHLRLH